MTILSGLVAAFCLYELLLMWPAIFYAGGLAAAAFFFALGRAGAMAEIAQMKKKQPPAFSSTDPVWRRLIDAEQNGSRRGSIKPIGLLQGIVLSARYQFRRNRDAPALEDLEALAKQREIGGSDFR